MSYSVSLGGYAFFETSSLAVQQLPGIQAKAWLKSPVYQPTTPRGHCLRFSVRFWPFFKIGKSIVPICVFSTTFRV